MESEVFTLVEDMKSLERKLKFNKQYWSAHTVAKAIKVLESFMEKGGDI